MFVRRLDLFHPLRPKQSFYLKKVVEKFGIQFHGLFYLPLSLGSIILTAPAPSLQR